MAFNSHFKLQLEIIESILILTRKVWKLSIYSTNYIGNKSRKKQIEFKILSLEISNVKWKKKH